MAINATSSATRRRNVKPVSSIIKPHVTRSADCSAMSPTPEDGQFVIMAGKVASHAAVVFHSSVNLAAVTATDVQAAGVKMVWGSARRSDRQATSNEAVSVMPHIGSMEIETHLFDCDNAQTMDNALNYPLGTLVSVGVATAAVEGSAARLVLTPMAEDDYGWAFGRVTGYSPSGASKLAGAQGAKLHVLLFENPMKLNGAA